LKRIQSSELLHAKMNPTSCLFGSRFACAQTVIFSTEPRSKNTERHQLLIVYGLRLVGKEFQHLAIQTKIEQDFGRFFQNKNKSAPANRKTGLYANRDLNKQEVGFIFA
jgi:hypothetical protein